GKAPKKIAWIQCIGSRDKSCGNNYCSAVCCMYAVKQVILSEENIHGMQGTIFHNDVRAYGKGFERYYDRAKKAAHARFIWSKVTVVRQNKETGSVVIRYRASSTEMKEEEFDLVVLSVGLTIPQETKDLAKKLSIKLNEYGFCESPEMSPMFTSREGIYACGVFNSPKDIPDSVTMACGAASLSEQLLADQRGTLITEKTFPVERDVLDEPPKIGVFVCRCGTNIGRIVDTQKAVDYAKTLPNVVYSEVSSFICSIDSVNHITETIRKNGLNRIVVAACTPRTHEPVFQAALREAGLNPYLFEMANIREHCSWVHMADQKAALQKAEDLIRMAVAKVTLLSPLYELSYNINHDALVIGGGVSGMVSAQALAKQGYKVHLVEKAAELGGTANKITSTIDGKDIHAYIQDLAKQIHKNSHIKVHMESEVGEIAGFVGNFKTKIVSKNHTHGEEITHGAIVVATGGNELKTDEYLHGQNPRVLTQMELEQKIAKDGAKLDGVQTMVSILCVGSRNNDRPYCSRVCCSQAIKNALKLKKANPDMDIYMLYRDIRTYGLNEDYYKEAAELGIRFIRYELEDKPEVTVAQDNGKEVLRVTVTDPLLGDKVQLDADILALAVATVTPEGNKALSQMLKVPLNEDGFFMEAHMKLRPVDFSTDGIFMCGLAHYPKTIEESVAQAEAAASRASTILSKDTMKADARVCSVDETFCSGCGICEAVCPYGAIAVNHDCKVSSVNEALCKGCGTCAAACPAGAVGQRGFRSDQISAVVAAALK
ncbi:MAG TPA: FAD-dependent oxidoreductase, partial [Dehalococcoidales bacterium]|nr:FAD-dependent oxidoreductase [Dehalococcoidales bacterium]